MPKLIAHYVALVYVPVNLLYRILTSTQNDIFVRRV